MQSAAEGQVILELDDDFLANQAFEDRVEELFGFGVWGFRLRILGFRVGGGERGELSCAGFGFRISDLKRVVRVQG